jgi:hypothetical protein
MDIVNIIVLFLVVLIIFLVVKQFLPSVSFKSKAIKKSEIIDGYKKQLDSVNDRSKKMILLKQINQELSRNIFFDQTELKEAMTTLTNHIVK